MNLNPAESDNKDKAIVTVHVNISKVLNILEGSEIFSVQFDLLIVWQDPRLTYRNLKEESFMNIVSTSEGESIWYPVLVFKNTRGKDKSLVCIIFTTTFDNKFKMVK